MTPRQHGRQVKKTAEKASKLAAIGTETASIGPESDEISAAEAASVLRLTAQAIGLWTNRPGAPVRKVGQHVWVKDPAFFRWREAELKREAKESATPGDFESARTRKVTAEAELAEIEVAKARGDVVAIADYEAALARVLDRLTARLRAMPVRLAHLGDTVEVEAEREVERIIVELNEWDEDVIDEPAQERAA